MPMPSPSSGNVEAVAEVPGHHVDADAAEQQPDSRHQQRPRQRGRRHVGQEDEAENEQRGVFRRPEAQREGAERRRDHRQRDDAEGAGDERADRGDAERRAGAALLRHGVAVDAGHHRRRFAWNAHQDRGGRAAVLRAVVDAGQHHDRLGGVEPERHRQEDADAGERTDAGQHADQRADEAAEKGIEQHARLECDREAEQQAVDGRFHGGSEPERHGRQRRFQQRVEHVVGADGHADADRGGAPDVPALDEVQQHEQQRRDAEDEADDACRARSRRRPSRRPSRRA